jgi:hypothetical protein
MRRFCGPCEVGDDGPQQLIDVYRPCACSYLMLDNSIRSRIVVKDAINRPVGICAKYGQQHSNEN